jgi:hypothetical protein
MADEITIAKALSIRDCGFKEGWLQDQIEKDPSILGLGDLEVVRREKTQSSGGRLDFLLQDSQDSADGSMYEVEVMLGETDASHIVRTIEYWDLERRPSATELLNKGRITPGVRPYADDPNWQTIRWIVDQNSLQENAKLFQEIAKLIGRSWKTTGDN